MVIHPMLVGFDLFSIPEVRGERLMVGGKWLCVVVKYEENDAFVVTAYLTDKPKSGEDLWPTK